MKELVENALDAEARAVHVEIEKGGAALARVRDDGVGMSRGDAELALERHATSKLRTLEDLQAIATHGFRGEALPSIAAVSELVLRTRTEGSAAGTEIAVSHGHLHHVRDVGHPRGTTVEVRDLFGAVPARRKFLRAASTEASHVAEAVTLLALARPGVGFFLKSGSRPIIEAPPVDGLGPRLYQIFGARLLEDLVPVEGGADWAVVRGFASRPDRPGPARPSLRLFVNGRPVRDRALAKAVSEAYRGAGGRGDRGFEAFVFVEVPAHLVDVNVHPAKTEVRFAESRTVFAAVERAVREALASGVRELPPVRVEVGEDRGAPDVVGGAEKAVQSFLDHAPRHDRVGEGQSPYGRGRSDPVPAAEGSAVPGEAAAPTVLGQHRLTYIVATDGDELVLVDQHTAHERVRFEQLLEQAGRHVVESQGLVTPLVFELPPELRPLLETHGESLRELGFDVEAFGGGSSRIRAVPTMLGHRDPGPTLEGILRDLAESDDADWAVAGPRDRLAATLACHSSVRAGQPLGTESMAAIVRDLFRTVHPTLCPHGRPTIVRVPQDELSRWFGRTGWRRR